MLEEEIGFGAEVAFVEDVPVIVGAVVLVGVAGVVDEVFELTNAGKSSVDRLFGYCEKGWCWRSERD